MMEIANIGFRVVFFSILLWIANAQASEVVVSKQSKISILEQSSIYIDEKNLILEDIVEKNLFRPYKKPYLNIGMKPLTVWIAFVLRNDTNQSLSRVLVLSSPLLEEISLYEADPSCAPLHNGRMHSSPEHNTLGYKCHLKIEPKSSIRYYLRIRSAYTPVSFGLTLQDEAMYFEQDKRQQLVAAMLLSVIMALALYNFLISLRTGDKGYLYYSIYLAALTWHQMSYLGLSQIYLSADFNSIDTVIPNLKSSLIVLFSALFAIDFLKIKELPKLYSIYKIFIFITISNLVLSYVFDIKALYGISIISFFYIIFTLASGIVSYRHGNKQARLFILGFTLLFTSYVALLLDTLGITTIMIENRSILVWSTAIDALILSLAFADRYMILQDEKTKADQQILQESKNREQIIQTEVTQKTSQLKDALETKEILLREVHHRVKNNLQIILSMVRLQNDNTKAQKIKEKFISLESRINAIAQTYDVLIGENDLGEIDMDEYIDTLLSDIETGYGGAGRQIEIKKEINATLPLAQSVYVGLIINELVSNAYKYAFDGDEGTIAVVLEEENDSYLLMISDNGKGFSLGADDHVLGLKLVDALVHGQLNGTMKQKTKNGTKYTIRFDK